MMSLLHNYLIQKIYQLWKQKAIKNNIGFSSIKG